MTSAQKRTLITIAASAALFLVAVFLPQGAPKIVVFLASYVLVGWDVLSEAAENIAHGEVFDENFLMSVATLGALFIGEYPEAVAVMLLYQIGEFFQRYALGKSRKSIAALMDIRPDSATVERGGTTLVVSPEEVAVGEILSVKPSERIPLDGVVVEGISALNTSALTGESIPRDVAAGDEVISGCVNQTGLLRVRVTKPYAESTVVRILDLVENSSSKKSRSENFISKFAQ